MIIIDDKNYDEGARGLVPRNYKTHPIGYLARPFNLPLIPESKWQAYIDMKNETHSWLTDIRDMGMFGKPIPSRDQGMKGYCWCHSSTAACLLLRASMNLPYADLSAYAVACLIKDYKDEGGYGSESLEWITRHGIPTSKTWPQQSMNRSNDTIAMRKEALKYKVTEWMDGTPGNLNQLITCLLLNIPVVSDFNWWGHSVCSVKVISIDPLETVIWNSWGDKWSENGMGRLKGSMCVPDGMIMPRVLNV